MASFSGTFVLRGTFIHAPTFGELEYLEDHVCVVSSKGQGGKILSLVPASESTTVLAQHGLLESTVYKIPVSYLITDRIETPKPPSARCI